MGSTATALVAFSGWYILLTFAMALHRGALVLGGKKAANSFTNDGADLAGVGHRLTRARNNCFETLPVFAAIALGAFMSGHTNVTDPLAMWVVVLRVLQSTAHLVSTSVPVVLMRANFFFAQMLIYLWWVIQLLRA